MGRREVAVSPFLPVTRIPAAAGGFAELFGAAAFFAVGEGADGGFVLVG